MATNIQKRGTAAAAPQQRRMKYHPTDFGRVGQYDTVLKMMSQRFELIDAVVVAECCIEAPITPRMAEALFAGSFDPFSAGNALSADTMGALNCRFVNAAILARVLQPIAVCGIGIIATGEGKSFTITGAAVTAATFTGGPTPCFDGCVPLGGLGEPIEAGGPPADPAARNATFMFGGPTWDALLAFMRAYRVLLVLNGYAIYLDQLAADIGTVCESPELMGFSNSLTSVIGHVNRLNTLLASIGCSKRFITQNVAGSDCVPPPVAGVSWGQPDFPGCANHGWRFHKPLILTPLSTFEVIFQQTENDTMFRQRLIDALSVDCDAATRPVPEFEEMLQCGNGYASAYEFKGGVFCFGVALKGVELLPSACVDFWDYNCPVWSPFREIIPSVSGQWLAGLPDVQTLKIAYDTRPLAGQPPLAELPQKPGKQARNTGE